MRTLQEKYNGVNEGAYSKDQFLRDARLQLPNLVTRFNGYDDAVQILKNRGMLSEGIHDRDMLSRPLSNPHFEPLERSSEELGKEADRGSESILKARYSNQIRDPKISDDELRFILSGKGVKGFGGRPNAVNNIINNRSEIQEVEKVVPTKEKVNVLATTDEEFADYLDNLGAEEFKQILKGLGSDVAAKLKSIVGNLMVKAGYLEPGDLEKPVKEDYSRVLGLEDGKYFAIDGDWEDQYQGKSGLFFTVKGNTVFDKNGKAIQSSPREFISQFTPDEILKVETISEARLTKNNLADYRYKPTNDMDKYPYEQILRGLRVELETLGVTGTPTEEQYAKAIAKVASNLQKDAIFYTNQLAGIKSNRKRTDVMVDATPRAVVDKENGMQKAALKEAIKSVIKNILKEDDSSVHGLYDDEDQYKMYPGDRDVYGAEEVDEELWDLFSPYIHNKRTIRNQIETYKQRGFSALSKELQDHLKDDERFKNWTSIYGKSEVEGDEDDEDFSQDLPFEGVDEVATDVAGFPKWRELSQDEKDHISKFVKDSGDRDQAAYEKRREERLKAQSQRLEKYIRGGKENEGVGLSPEGPKMFESVSLKDILD